MAKGSIKLSEKDTKHTLSAKKKVKLPKTVLIKNVTEYWPLLDDLKIANFIEILELYLSNYDEIKQQITIGLESTIRNLKSCPCEISLLAIADDISPKWFGKHLISMALAKNSDIKIIIMPDMKSHTNKLFKVPSIVWSMKNSESFDDFYKDLNIHSELVKHYLSIKKNADVSVKRKRKVKDSKCPEIIHLKKSSPSSSPIFTPDQEEEDTSPTTMQFDESSDFISLAKFDDPVLVNKSSPLSSYRPMKVKKIVGNLLRKGKK